MTTTTTKKLSANDVDFDNRMAYEASEAAQFEAEAEAENDRNASLETEERIALTEATRKALGKDGCAWYDSLTPENHIQLRNAYIDKVVPGMGHKVSYEAWIILTSKLAIKFKGKEDRALRNTQRLMKRQGLR